VNNPQLVGKPAVEPTPTTIALAHFDEFYRQVYQDQWSSMRLGLLTRQKYCAVVNNFGETEETCRLLTELGCVSVTQEVTDRQKLVVGHSKAVQEITTDNQGKQEGDIVREESKDFHDEDVDGTAGTVYNLDPADATSRLIDPDERVLSGGEADAMYDFVPTSRLKGTDDFVEESEYYEHYEKVKSAPMKIESESLLNFPAHLHVFTFPPRVLDSFPKPQTGLLKTTNYYCMDLASLLPVLCLGTRPGDAVLDMCSAPGGKALCLIQTLLPGVLVCNDVNRERLSRVASVLGQFLGAGDGVAGSRKNVRLQRMDGREMCDFGTYDRVLCDVPCFSDRHSLHDNESTYFHKANIKDRLRLPELQTELLRVGLMQLKTGGSLVYSTCTLSPVQNDGVVNMALTQLWETTDAEFVINDLSEAVQPFRDTFLKMRGKNEGVKYGQLVVPYLPNNFGPMYIAKITRKK